MNNEKQRITIDATIAQVTGLDLPFSSCLNAMHEAEKMLTEHQWGEYERVLRLVCDGCSYYEGAGKELLHATAAQRAEAFLRTLGKWEGAK